MSALAQKNLHFGWMIVIYQGDILGIYLEKDWNRRYFTEEKKTLEKKERICFA